MAVSTVKRWYICALAKHGMLARRMVPVDFHRSIFTSPWGDDLNIITFREERSIIRQIGSSRMAPGCSQKQPVTPPQSMWWPDVQV
mmetsp:Transcript_146549/g.270424  ORF Transcript_146549/g.270424 Transcript_146549/m.270424 type:complete len:86 (-) Transcript_146549:15-272(-)